MRDDAAARFQLVRFSAKLICHATLAIMQLDLQRTKREHTYHPSVRNIDMLNNLASGSLPESERLDLAADQAIAACGGDMHSTIRALILANEFLEYELCEMFKAVTNGRGKLPGNRADLD